VPPAASLALALLFVVLLGVERLLPLRVRVEPGPRRLGRNLVLGGISLGISELLTVPLVLPLADWVATRRLGLLGLLPGLAAPWRVLLGVLLLDYTLWWWHWLNHRVRWLWRLHLVHHADPDLDASTGLRFHAGEMVLSVGYRAAQVALLGVSAPALAAYQALLFASVAFHHSNTRLPFGLERVLVHVLVTPRMHGIHHSDYREETDSNYASLLSVWDRLHGTLRLGVAAASVRIGVPAYQGRPLGFLRLLALPFDPGEPAWSDPPGERLSRPDGPTPAARHQLAP
jgi:sterol desaturase/sphingolipid hydroxylase (fatty acid hydroxylase superfamily)